MKKLLLILIGLLVTIFGCKSAAPDEMQERFTFKTKDGQEFSISKEVIVTFSGLIRDYSQFYESPMSFESDIVKPEALKAQLSLLEQASSVLIDRPISKKGSYRQLADLIIECNVNIDLDLMVLTDFFDLDERIKQACALAVINQMEKERLTCKAMCALLPDDLSSQNILSYIAQQYYLINDTVPEEFERYIKEIGVSVRDLLVYEKPFPIKDDLLNLHGRYIRDVEGVLDIPGIDQVLGLGLYNNQLKSIEGLDRLHNLTCLYFDNDQMKTIESLNILPGLIYFYLDNDQLKAIEGLNSPNLRQLDFEDNSLRTFFGRMYTRFSWPYVAGAGVAGVAACYYWNKR